MEKTTIPYFYIIQHVGTGKYYAGSRTARSANPAEFLVDGGYTTSSKIINAIISQEGLGAFTIRRLLVFSTKKQAFDFETRFLRKVKAQSNPKFFNGHNNKLHNAGSDGYKNAMMKQYGVEHPMHHPDFKKKQMATNIKKYGSKCPLLNESVLEKAKRTMIRKYGVDHFSKSELFAQRVNASMQQHYKVDWAMQSTAVKQKSKRTVLSRYGVENVAQSAEIQQRTKMTNIERYGTEHNSKTNYTCPACGHVSNLNWLSRHIDQCEHLKERISGEFHPGSSYSELARDRILSASHQQIRYQVLCQCRRCKTRQRSET